MADNSFVNQPGVCHLDKLAMDLTLVALGRRTLTRFLCLRASRSNNTFRRE